MTADALKVAREWLTNYGASRWCEDPKCECCVKDAKSLAALILRERRAARAKALEWVVESVEVGIITGHKRYRTIAVIETELSRLRAGTKETT